MNQENAIEVRGLSKTFKIHNGGSRSLKDLLTFSNRGKVTYNHVLKDITLDVKKGETVALIGTNGSGKSTLLKLMTKIIYPNTGKIETTGRMTSLLELGAGFHIEFTGRENIYFNASIFGLTRKQIDQRLDKIIEFSELGEFIDQPVRTYSSGMYMRLAFSVAINVDADILLIDEILAVGDQYFQDKCLSKLEELKQEGKTIVFVSHSLDTVKKLCHRAVWIYKGEIKGDGLPEKVIDEYLNRVQLDHQLERQKAIDEGTFVAKAIVNIDLPKLDFPLEANNGLIKFRGWVVSNAPDSSVKIYLDDKLLEWAHEKRIDVFQMYEEEYRGYITAEHCGWSVLLEENAVQLGQHQLRLVVEDMTGKTLSEKSVTFEKR